MGTEAGFGGDHQIIAAQIAAHEPAEKLLGASTAVGGGGVDQVAAGVHERPDQPARVVQPGVAAPGHGAEARARHREPARADAPPQHGVTLRPTGQRGRGYEIRGQTAVM